MEAELTNGSVTSWLSELEMEDCDLFLKQCPLNLLDEDDTFLCNDLVSAAELESLQHTWSPPDEPSFAEHVSPSSSPSCSSQVLLFDNNTGFDPTRQKHPSNLSFSAQAQAQAQNTEKRKGQGTKRSREGVDHIMAERKRREKLSQSLIALAALIPGLKKMDKASVLGDAIKYVKELQERLRVLEEQNNKREVVIFNSSEDDDSSSLCDDDSFEAATADALPHVEARVAENEVLLRIHCHRHKGIYVRLLAEIHRFNLFVVNSSALPFGDSVLDITIVAKMGTDYKLTIKDLIRNLRVATLRSVSS